MASSAAIPVPDLQDDYCLTTGAVTWSGGQALLLKGKRWEGDEKLLIERPDLFGTRTAALRPEIRKVDCKQCMGKFAPQSDDTQYCSTKCRRARERLLARAARNVTRRSWPAIPRTSGDIREKLAEVDDLLTLTRLLITHLGGRFMPGEPAPEPDMAELKTRLGQPIPMSEKAELSRYASKAYTELTDLRNEMVSALDRAMHDEREAAEAERNMDWYRESERRRFALRDEWDDKLAADESPGAIAMRHIG
jgi:hypothetical protein